MKKYLFVIVLIMLFSCGKKREKADVMNAVKETGKLVTAEYTLIKIIKANDNKTWYKIGDRKILMSCEAHLKAGIDLQKITSKNVVQNDSSIQLSLPHAEIFSLNIPADKIQLQYQQIDLLRQPFSAAEREELLAQAQLQIQQLADSLGILKTAEDNASLFLKRMLQQTTSRQIEINFN